MHYYIDFCVIQIIDKYIYMMYMNNNILNIKVLLYLQYNNMKIDVPIFMLCVFFSYIQILVTIEVNV